MVDWWALTTPVEDHIMEATGRYLCETCFDNLTNHVVDVRGCEEAVCDACDSARGTESGQEEEYAPHPAQIVPTLRSGPGD